MNRSEIILRSYCWIATRYPMALVARERFACMHWFNVHLASAERDTVCRVRCRWMLLPRINCSAEDKNDVCCWFHMVSSFIFFIPRLSKFPHPHTRFDLLTPKALHVQNTTQVSKSRASSRFVCFVALPLCVTHFYDGLNYICVEKCAFSKVDSQDFDDNERDIDIMLIFTFILYIIYYSYIYTQYSNKLCHNGWIRRVRIIEWTLPSMIRNLKKIIFFDKFAM